MKALLPLVLLAALAACRNDEIEVRRVPRGDVSAVAPAEALPQGSAQPRGLRWTVPPGWKELAGGGMRRATFTLPEAAGKAEVTVVALSGDVGGELANVNRWRGQLALAPLSEAQLAGARASVRSRAGTVAVYDFTGGGAAPQQTLDAGRTLTDLGSGTSSPKGSVALPRGSARSAAPQQTLDAALPRGSARSPAKTRLIAGMVKAGEVLWFFKLMGEEKAVAAATPRFLKFLETLRSDGI